MRILPAELNQTFGMEFITSYNLNFSNTFSLDKKKNVRRVYRFTICSVPENVDWDVSSEYNANSANKNHSLNFQVFLEK